MKRKAVLIENEILPPGITRKPFSDAVRAGKTLYVSGRIGIDPSTSKPPAEVADEARALMENLKGVMDAAGMKMKELVQVTVFSPDLSLYATFNDVYLSYFDQDDLPARAFIGSGPLLFGARFELTAIAVSR
jgi:2-iminobutanoate/2-iminopropanoate deaminase